MVTVRTMNYIEEALGVAKAAKRLCIPVVVSFTAETDGSLPTGQSIKEAIEIIDLATDSYVSYYMINCAHPTHLTKMFEASKGQSWISRLRGVRCNASNKSHAELDGVKELDMGCPLAFGFETTALKALNPYLTVFGGCCGTDKRHV